MLEDMSRRHKRQPVNIDRVSWTLTANAICACVPYVTMLQQLLAEADSSSWVKFSYLLIKDAKQLDSRQPDGQMEILHQV